MAMVSGSWNLNIDSCGLSDMISYKQLFIFDEIIRRDALEDPEYERYYTEEEEDESDEEEWRPFEYSSNYSLSDLRYSR